MSYIHRELLYTFTLPLACAPTGNNIHPGIRAGLKKQAYDIMLEQLLEQGGEVGQVLPAGCLVRCTRYSSKQPDSVDGNKIPIDRLLPSRVVGRGRKIQGLGLIVDDSPVYIHRVDRWRYAPPRDGRFELELFSLPQGSVDELQQLALTIVMGMNTDQLFHFLDLAEQ